MKKMVIGLTGGFGTGKSTVAGLFQELGACVVDADRLAHEALLAESPVAAEILKLVPDADPGGASELDRKKIAKAVFEDAAKRKKLEALIHPYVFERMEEEIADARERVVVVEVPLLFETGFDKRCDRTVTVIAPGAAAVERLKQKGFSAREIEERQKAQLSLEEKRAKSDWAVDNAGSFENTRNEVKKIWNEIQKELKKGEES